MSNLEATADVVTCPETDGTEHPNAPVEVITPRSVPLGGLRAMPVRRTLPQRARSLIGAWCFADHYGPDDVATTGGMVVPPHPHTGLQTVSWLFEGEIEHRDSTGVHAMVHPGELNLMTAGRGIAHSEISTERTTVLHGAQLWLALPDDARDTAPGFQHYAPTPIEVPGARLSVFLGTLAGDTSPVQTFSPLLGAEITVEPGARVALDIDEHFEHGVLVDTGALLLDGARIERSELGYLAPGRRQVVLRNPTAAPTRALLLGGTPFGEQIIMWWNFVGRATEEIKSYRRQWQAEIGDAEAGAPDGTRFGPVSGGRSPIPAPTLPNVSLKPRS
ncbi:pirin family protein [Aldersonia kunmingensis]|uniref:pirin family protein n=1 Tax=Aldersonia kunmingensis TaxID=408066 RepID=UPI00082989A7|nr:pirin family protein [Aldersonia kunmingensis]